jgi:uncharacterized repeat protein (TIGR01451 family)
MEGFHQFDPANMTKCDQPIITPAGITRPITEYEHPIGEAVSGGFVYRGQAYPWLAGWYFYGDYQTGLIWVIKQTQPGVWSGAQKLSSGLLISSFGEDESGEVYLVHNGGSGTGALYKITSTSPIDFSSSTKQASASTAVAGTLLTYTIVVRNTGGPLSNTVRVTDVLPVGLTYVPGTLTTTHGTVDATAAPTLKWNGVMSTTPVVTLTCVTLSTSTTRAIANNVTIEPENSVLTRTATIIATAPVVSAADLAQPVECSAQELYVPARENRGSAGAAVERTTSFGLVCVAVLFQFVTNPPRIRQ